MAGVTRKTVLADLIADHGWTFGAELGVWQGELSAYLLERFPKLHLCCVDHWLAEGPYASKDMAAAEAQARKALAVFGERCWILKDYTVAAAPFIMTPLDFVFIDASHDTESVLQDIQQWRPKVRPGGALTGHDCNWPTVRAALNQALPGWRRLEANVWIYDLEGE